MTPAELQCAIDGKVKIERMNRDMLLQYEDRMIASQTARIVNMINIRGKEMVLKDDVLPENCMAFVWKTESPQETMSEEEKMDELDRNMSTWERA